MAITAKVRNKQIDTGKVLHALVQGEHASGNITFQIIGEEELVEDFASTYFYLLYTRPSDTRPNVLLLTNKQLQDDVISVTFKPTSYFTAQDGTVQIQIMATDTEGLSIDSETGTISGSVIWQTFPGAMFVHASQLTGTETIIEENVLTQYLAGMQELYSQTEDAEGDAADYAQLAKDWASKTNGAVEGGNMSAKYYAGTADSRAKEAEGYAVGTISGSPSATFAGKNAKELASDAQDWAKGTRSDGKTPSHTSDNAKAYAESAADSAAIVSAHAEAIDAIGDDLTNIDAVAADILDDDSAIDAVAENITNVNAVAANETNINAVNTNKTNINTVAGKATEITTVAGIASDVSAVAAIASDVAAVEDIDDDVSAVAAIAVDVGVVADAATDVAAVADGITDVGTVATNISDVGAVASDITKIAAVADDLTNIDAVADDLENIDDAVDYALEAEGWANGTQNGTDVGSTSPYYHNNAKYWAGAVPALQSKVEANSKRITNLEQKAGDQIVIDYPDTSEYDLGMDGVPANVAQYAKVRKLKGNTRVWNQLVNIQAGSSTTDHMVTFTPNSDGTVTVSGTATGGDASYQIAPITNGHTYVWGGCPNGGSTSTYFFGTSTSYADTGAGAYRAFSVGSYSLSIWIKEGTTVNLTFKPILRDLTIYFNTTDFSFLGATDSAKLATIQQNYPELLVPGDYEAGSLVSTTYSGVKSVGVNIWDEEWKLGNYSDSTGEYANVGNYVVSKNPIPILLNHTYYCNKLLRKFYYTADMTYIGNTGNLDSAFTTPADAYYMNIRVHQEAGAYNNDVQICDNALSSEVKNTYHPYMGNTLSLPEEVTLRRAGSVYEEYDLETGKKTNPLGSYTFDGTETWVGWSSDASFCNELQTLIKPASSNGVAYENMVTDSGLSIVSANTTGASGGIAVTTGGAFLCANSARSSLTGKTIYFELATPSADTPLTPILDPFIEVEGGGSIMAIQSQTEKIDHAFTAEYLAV